MSRLVLMGMMVLCVAALARADEGDLQIEGVGTVPRPAEGYVWKKERQTEEKDKPRVQFFSATKEGSPSKVVLIVEETVADSTAKRRARIKADYTAMLTSLKEQGYTDLQASDPPIKPPVADLVGFLFIGNDKNGKPGAMLGVLYFGKSVYHFQISAPTEKEARLLAKAADGIKEP